MDCIGNVRQRQLSSDTKKKEDTQLFLPLTFLLIGLLIGTSVLNAYAQSSSTSEIQKKKDIFKVIMTVQGLDHNTGDVVTIVSVNGESRVKLFDDAKTYIPTVNATDGTGGIIEYIATFPNMTVNVGDEYKVCALTIKNSNLMCQTGADSPASRPEFIDLFLQEGSSTTSQAALASNEEGE
jgi:hypothetical protein